jgi:hypothetical protein
MNEELKAGCTHRAVANFPVGGMSEGWRDRWLCDACRTEFVPLVQVSAQLKEAREALRHLMEVGASLCCALGADGAMNTEAFARLCDLAMHCGCTHLSWWTFLRFNDFAEPDGCKGRCSSDLELAADSSAAVGDCGGVGWDGCRTCLRNSTSCTGVEYGRK